MLRLHAPEPDFVRSFEKNAADPSHPLLPRWARAATLGLHREADAYPTGISRAALRERCGRLEDVFREEQTLFAPIAAELAAQSLCAIIADADGILLSVRDGGVFSSAADRARLVEGADWSEQARGTNGIGTAIVERTVVAVIGGAHYERRNGALFCYGTPIFDARGELVAVLDVSGPIDRHDDTVGVAVRMAGASLERALRSMAFARAGLGNLATIERLVSRARSAALLVEARGPVRLCNDLARRDVLDGRVSVDCAALFGIEFAALAELARCGKDMSFETRDKTYAASLDPVLDSRGQALGVIVHLEPKVRSSSSRDRLRVPASSTPLVPVQLPGPFDTIFALDAAVVRAKESAARVAQSASPTLLSAEPGAGKETFARAIHAASTAASGPFVAVSCRDVAPEMLEGELFGSRGLLGAANGGSLYVEEIAEMPVPLQKALLHALEEGAFRHAGAAQPERSSFRLIAATSCDLPTLLEAGTLRRDLFYRIHGGSISIPPLRRRTDRAGLARALLSQMRARPPELGPTALDYIDAHAWPGNVRELELALAHALLHCGGGAVEREHFPEPLGGSRSTRASRRRYRGRRS